MAFLARGTAHWVLAPLALGAALLALPGAAPALGAGLVALAGFLAWFFRDPERAPGEGLVSPADGRVQRVAREPDGSWLVSVFMSPLDVHVNRAPCACRVARREHFPGAHLPAFRKESERNERVAWSLDTPYGPVRVTQVAGLVARRIVPYAREGEALRKGERLGIIRLGSRVDVRLPPGCEPAVQPGQRLRAGSSTLARPAANPSKSL